MGRGAGGGRGVARGGGSPGGTDPPRGRTGPSPSAPPISCAPHASFRGVPPAGPCRTRSASGQPSGHRGDSRRGPWPGRVPHPTAAPVFRDTIPTATRSSPAMTAPPERTGPGHPETPDRRARQARSIARRGGLRRRATPLSVELGAVGGRGGPDPRLGSCQPRGRPSPARPLWRGRPPPTCRANVSGTCFGPSAGGTTAASRQTRASPLGRGIRKGPNSPA